MIELGVEPLGDIFLSICVAGVALLGLGLISAWLIDRIGYGREDIED